MQCTCCKTHHPVYICPISKQPGETAVTHEPLGSDRGSFSSAHPGTMSQHCLRTRELPEYLLSIYKGTPVEGGIPAGREDSLAEGEGTGVVQRRQEGRPQQSPCVRRHCGPTCMCEPLSAGSCLPTAGSPQPMEDPLDGPHSPGVFIPNPLPKQISRNVVLETRNHSGHLGKTSKAGFIQGAPVHSAGGWRDWAQLRRHEAKWGPHRQRGRARGEHF